MILDKAKTTIKKFNLIEANDRILAGVSGGPDSVALLYVLKKLSKQLKFSLYVAHLDHKIRKDSYKDTQFVENLCAKWKLALTVKQIDIKKIAKKGSIEEIARNERLKFFIETAKAVKANKIALGHNLDDQAETVLMRLIRGSGLYGLSAILPKRKFNNLYIIRPLIETMRKGIESFLKKKKIIPCIDKSNMENIYFRNKIRNRLLPLLEKEYNSNIKEVLSNTAETVGYDYDYLIQQAERVTRRQGAKINLKKIIKLHPAMQRMVLRLVIAKVNKDMRRITYKHIEEIQDLILHRPVNSVVNLPKGLEVVKKNFHLFFITKV